MPNKANAMRRKMMRASRGADPKRPTEPRRGEGRLDTHLELTAPAPMGGDSTIWRDCARKDASFSQDFDDDANNFPNFQIESRNHHVSKNVH
jgi:hypothetical protein